MKEQIIITVGREHGSGGHYVAQLISEKLGIKLYDKEIVEGTATDNGFTRELVERMDEKPVNFFFSRRIGEYSNSLEENVAQRTFDFIRAKLITGESFVVVGRCAEEVLKDEPNLIRVFISGDKADKLQRIMTTDGVDEAKADEIIRTVDRRRKTYHNYYSEHKWGDSRGYDVVMNTSRLGISGTADALIYYIKAFQAI
ncbi:MAG TPA: cytidylate kinase-like family protein [Oscillospiraceae bacterium]|nr:cytidylate kinase-like family protein [Oscillospiraceae bacterium]HPS75153.1 cytidylate kinase-like family protein [Oscillospiraceae bacterium]